MFFTMAAVLIIGTMIGVLIGLISPFEPRTIHVLLRAIAGAWLGGYLGAYAGIMLVILLLPPSNVQFSGLVPGLIGWGMGALVGATSGGIVGAALLRHQPPGTQKRISFVLTALLMAIGVVQASTLAFQFAPLPVREWVMRLF